MNHFIHSYLYFLNIHICLNFKNELNQKYRMAHVVQAPAILPVYILIGRDFDIGFDISKGPGSRI